MDDVISAIFHISGIDYEARPILCVYSCNFPDPNNFNYDEILERIIHKLDDFVENDYVLILFTAGGDYKPGWRWLYKAYRALSRKYKKNLKNLYVVHPNIWIRLTMDAMKAIISPKFAKKLIQVESLTKLASLVPYKQLRIPEAVLQHNKSIEKSVYIPDIPPPQFLFGVALEMVMKSKDNPIPICITQSVEYLVSNGMEVEGLFRRSPSSAQLKEIKASFDQGKKVDYSQYESDVHLAAVIIKCYLRELPSPIIPSSLYQQFTEISQTSTPKDLVRIYSGISSPSILLFSYLLLFFNELTCDPKRVAIHKMSPSNLGIVLGPNLVRCSDPIQEMEISRQAGMFVKSLLENWQEFMSVVKESLEFRHVDESFQWAQNHFLRANPKNASKNGGNVKAESNNDDNLVTSVSPPSFSK